MPSGPSRAPSFLSWTNRTVSLYLQGKETAALAHQRQPRANRRESLSFPPTPLAYSGIVTDATLSLQPRYRAGSVHESGGCFEAIVGGGGGAASRAASNAIHPNSTEVDIHIYIYTYRYF